jgi:hypothetical protein
LIFVTKVSQQLTPLSPRNTTLAHGICRILFSVVFFFLFFSFVFLAHFICNPLALTYLIFDGNNDDEQPTAPSTMMKDAPSTTTSISPANQPQLIRASFLIVLCLC